MAPSWWRMPSQKRGGTRVPVRKAKPNVAAAREEMKRFMGEMGEERIEAKGEGGPSAGLVCKTGRQAEGPADEGFIGGDLLEAVGLAAVPRPDDVVDAPTGLGEAAHEGTV